MKFTVEREIFLSSVNKASKSVAQKTAIPVLEGLLIRTDGNKIIITGYNLETGITCEVEGNVSRQGVLVLSAQLLLNICRSANGSVIEIEESEKNGIVNVSSGTVFYKLTSMNSDDFPELPKPDAQPALSMVAKELKEIIDLTVFAVSQDEAKPANKGELFELTKESLTIVALDGFRMAVCKRPVISNTDINIVVPGKTMLELGRMISDNIETIDISVSRRYIVFSCEEFTIVSRLINEEFFDYKRAIPDGYTAIAKLNTKEFIQCIDRAALVINENIKNPLRITFDEKSVHLECTTSLGKVTDDMECEYDGEPMKIGFNYRYLQEALKATDCEVINIHILNSLKAVKIYPSEGDKFMFLVLPVRFKDE